MPQISVIVPVYNVEKYLHRCVDSILAQTFTDFELILVDDGSSDNSGIICDEYDSLHNNVKIIHQTNQGVSVARNLGLSYATGDIIVFVDSDDFVEPDYLQSIADEFESSNAQVVFYGFNKIVPVTNTIIIKNIPQLPKDKLGKIIELTKADMFGYTCIKAITRDLIDLTRFDEALNLFEDEVFTCEIMSKCPNISWIKKPLYNQVVSTESLSRKIHQDYYSKCEAVYQAWKELLAKYQCDSHPIIQEKANRMSKVCKWYYLEKNISPVNFAVGLSNCSFFQKSTENDKVIVAIKSRKISLALFYRIMYRIKMRISKLFSR